MVRKTTRAASKRMVIEIQGGEDGRGEWGWERRGDDGRCTGEQRKYNSGKVGGIKGRSE